MKVAFVAAFPGEIGCLRGLLDEETDRVGGERRVVGGTREGDG